MNRRGSKLGTKQEAAIAALLTQPNRRQAAAAAGVAVSTLERWVKDPAFATAWRTARRAQVEAAIAGIQRAAEEAVRTLRKNLKAAKASDQIRAAAELLERAVRGVELLDLAQQVEELRAMLEAKS